MKKLFFVFGLGLVSLGVVYVRADTNVFVRNATSFTFKVENLFNGQPSDDRMQSFATEIKPLSKTKIVGFNRNVGIKKGKTFIVTSLITSPELKKRIGLQQKLVGKGVGSKMWWGVAYPGHDTVFYDDNAQTWDKPVRFKLQDKKGNYHNFMVRYKTYEAGTYNDIEYVISGYSEPKKYTVQSTKGVPHKINVLSYNMFFIEVGPFFAAPARSVRAKLMPNFLKDYDVLVLNEAFDDDARRELLVGLKKVGFRYSTQILGAGFLWKGNGDDRFKMDRPLKQSAIIKFDDARFGKDKLYTQAGEGDPPSPVFFRGGVMDGGVIIVSKYPIETAKEIIYEPSGGGDRNAKKGAVYAKINKEGKLYHIFGTHPQADEEYHKERLNQLRVLKKFIDTQKIPANEPVLIAGDMNIDKYAGDFEKMLTILHATQPSLTGEEKYTYNLYKNNLAINYGWDEGRSKCFDYILYGTDYQKPVTSFNEIRIFCLSKPWGTVYNDLSDHYAVYGCFEFPA